jgi:hypothetical protein
VRVCIFCGSANASLTIEDVIPKWARRAFDIQGPVTVTTSDDPALPKRQVGQPSPVLKVILKDALCATCNNAWLGGTVEQPAAPLLAPMAVQRKPTHLDPAAQRLVALWAAKTVLLFELAIRQTHPTERRVEGYAPSEVELAYMWRYKKPPPRSMIWLGCWDCQQEKPVTYEPSSAALPTADGTEVAGHLATFALGYVAFQVFSVDFLAAEQHGAILWNTHVPESLDRHLVRIWPPAEPVTPDVTWPPAQFGADEWPRLVTWEGKLRPDGMAAYQSAR